ncbi:MAG: hypothetical protein A2286_00425 [Gammaproteobacteria bacterium RIFOXYA12_FULL_61_12]|nr:MAG: hypothetical protein A2286_00425 [Gammaproteobacteria bacterium RIFOXYA12_FULL_61_12]
MEDSVVIDIAQPLGVVCHDAGGANQILAMLGEPEFQGAIGYFDGPAREPSRRAASRFEIADDLPGLLGRVRTLVTGTGWSSRLEHDARDIARRRGIRSIAVLDHWTNYRERFVRDGSFVLPDELWVVDEYALDIASRTFPGLPIGLQPDRYAEQQVERIAPLSQVAGNELVYLLEPARSDWGRGEPGEFQALRYFLDRLPQLGLPAETAICLRPHPSDAHGKYDAFLGERRGHRIVLDNGDLAGALSRARWVAGCQTYALTLALRAGRTVYCTLPPWAPPCQLPHRGLSHLQRMGEP